MKPSVFKKASDGLVRYYKKLRYARFVLFYLIIWLAFGAHQLPAIVHGSRATGLT